MIRRTLFSLLTFNVIVTPAFAAADLEGKVDTTELSGEESQAQRQPLQGGVKNDASLNPSLKVIPGQKAPPNLQSEVPKYFYPTGAKLTQYHGSSPISSSPGEQTEYPILRSRTPSLAPLPRVWHEIPAVSSYTITPRNGVMSWAEGYGVSTTSSARSITTRTPSHEVSAEPSHRGVTSYAPGYEIQQGTSHGGITHYTPAPSVPTQFSPAQIALIFGERHSVPVPVSRNGITSYAPGYESIAEPTSSKGITSIGPGQGHANGTKYGGALSRTPSCEVSINTPRNGVVCWDSRYESSVTSNGLIKQTIGGMWSLPSSTPESGRNPRPQELAFKPLFVQPIVDAEPPLRAQTLPLGGGEKTASMATPEEKMTWDEWYKRMARAIYARWQNAKVGPGAARVLVTVTRDRDLVGRVREFWPAADVARDVDEETDFRSEALKSVNLVSSFEIPEFPEGSDLPSVSFEVDLKRKVDGPTGFDVAGVLDNVKPSESSKKVQHKQTSKKK